MAEVTPIRPGQWYEQGLLFDPTEYIEDIQHVGEIALAELIYVEFGLQEVDLPDDIA